MPMISAIRKFFKMSDVKVSKEGTTTTIEAPAGVMIVPPVGSEITLGGFRYRVRKVTSKDLVLRPIGNA